MDWGTAANLATAGGTLVLAVATFGATRSANRTARLTEKALRLGQQPLLADARPEDPPQRVMFADDRVFEVPGGTAAVRPVDDVIYFVIPVRNVGTGIAVLKSWRVVAGRAPVDEFGDLDEYRQHTRDLYIPGGGTGYWQGAIRRPDDPQRAELVEAIDTGGEVTVFVHYRNHYDGQPMVSRFRLSRIDGTWLCGVVRHFALDARH